MKIKMQLQFHWHFGHNWSVFSTVSKLDSMFSPSWARATCTWTELTVFITWNKTVGNFLTYFGHREFHFFMTASWWLW